MQANRIIDDYYLTSLSITTANKKFKEETRRVQHYEHNGNNIWFINIWSFTLKYKNASLGVFQQYKWKEDQRT